MASCFRNLQFLIFIYTVLSSSYLHGQGKMNFAVDPASGDLNGALSLLTIPGPEGDFPLMISYKSGIQVNQKSSWVGLGWQLAEYGIHRDLSGIPDDYSNGKIETHRSFTSKEEVITDYSNSWTFGGFLKRSGFFEPSDWFFAYLGLDPSLIESIMQIQAIRENKSARTSLNINPTLPTPWDFEYNVEYIGNSEYLLLWWLFEDYQQFGYGILHQDKMPTTNSTSLNSNGFYNPQLYKSIDFSPTEIISQDIKFYNAITAKDDETSYDDLNIFSDYYQTINEDTIFKELEPIFWNTDNYIVRTPSFTRSIRPLRLENSSVAANTGPVNQYYTGSIATSKIKLTDSYNDKVQFYFDKEPSNYYDYHISAYGEDEKNLNYDLLPVYLNGQEQGFQFIHIKEQHQAMTTSELAREGLTENKELVTGNKISWWTMEELREGISSSSGFMGNSDIISRDDLPDDGIGAFMITDISGVNYHFSLPEFVNKTVLSKNIDGFHERTTLADLFAQDWLLTSITGPNFIDRGELGVLDENDLGYFVSLNYAKFADNHKSESDARKINDNSNSLIYYTRYSEEYYLKSISTRTHTALFFLSDKQEELSFNDHDLKLDRIVLIGSDKLSDEGWLEGDNLLFSDELELNRGSINTSILKEVSFKYDYSLNNKLTLNQIEFYGLSNNSDIPTIELRYDYNPIYTFPSFDAWNFLNNDDENGNQRNSSLESTAWSLTRIQNNSRALTFSYESDSYSKVLGEPIDEGVAQRLGGNIRVSKLEDIDLISGSKRIKEYIYTINGEDNGITSGVILQEPNSLDGSKESAIKNLWGISCPNLVYSKVKEVVRSDQEILNYTVYDFHTAKSEMFTVNRPIASTIYSSNNHIVDGFKYGFDFSERFYDIKYSYDLIGRIEQVASFSPDDLPISKKRYFYEVSELGRRSQGLNLFDYTFLKYKHGKSDELSIDRQQAARFINTVYSYDKYLPTRTEITNYINNQTSEIFYSDFDFYTGNPLKTTTSDGYGNQLESNVTPAYHINAYKTTESQSGMGPVLYGGKNLLSAIASTESYIINSEEPESMLNASAQTFEYNDENWFANTGYVYNSPLETNGTVSWEDFTAYDHSNTANNIKWVNGTTVLKRDAHGKVIETVSNAGIKNSSKWSSDESYMVISTSGVDYQEYCFSSAEIYNGDEGFSAGVENVSGIRSSQAHSGQNALLTPAGSNSFRYFFVPTLDNKNEVYRISIWVNSSNSSDARIKCEVGGYIVNYDFNSSGKPNVDGWYLWEVDLDLSDFSISNTTEVTITVQNSGSNNVIVDDFKVMPVSGQDVCYVYDNYGRVTHQFDEQHYYSKYEYDDFGRIVNTYQETETGVKPRQEITYHHSEN